MGTPAPFTPDQIDIALRGRYAIHELLRVGGQGLVHRAHRVRTLDGSVTDDEVALKINLDPGQDERVEREIQAVKGHRHPNLAYLVEHGTTNIGGRDARYLAWEYIAGGPVDALTAAGPLTFRQAAVIGRDVSRAIEHLWTKRIVHRDVNPKNIMMRQGDHEAVLIDLGVARHLDRTTITAAGLTWGTAGYFSPEQCRCEQQLTCASDMYSLGISLQEALIGRHPTGRDQRRLYAGAPTTASLIATAPAGLANLIDELLRFRAAFRPHPSIASQRFSDLAAQL